MAENDEEKTEEPTQRRLDEARKKGQVAMSREVGHFFMILSLTLILTMIAPSIIKNAAVDMAKYLSMSHDMVLDGNALNKISFDVFSEIMLFLAAPFALFIIAAIAASFVQNGFFITTETITPKLEKISLIKGFGRMFSMKSVVELMKGLVKITIVGMVSYIAIAGDLKEITQISRFNASEQMSFIWSLAIRILIGVTIIVFLIAIIDFMYQKFEFLKQMRMSKQELKEEYKQQEGDPKIKGKLKQIRMERARKRMMAAVPTADVVITNPTHFAVALKYDSAQMAAPVLVAKGSDKVAERIKKLAEENAVPIVRNAPIARALFDECDLDEQIPVKHFKPVAEIISYVYKLKGKR